MESNDILNFSIPCHAGGIGKTYEESILVVISMGNISSKMGMNLDYVFFRDSTNGYVGVVSSAYKANTPYNVYVNYEEVLKEDRYQKYELLNLLPIGEDYAVVELIDPDILREHLSIEREFKLNRRYSDGR